MLKHLVFFNMKTEANGKTGMENATILMNMLKELPKSIEEIITLETGLNTRAGSSDAAWDVALYTSFKDEASLESYRVHPEHQKVVSFVVEVTENRAFVDYMDET